MAEVIDLTGLHADETLLGHFTLSLYLDDATGIVRLIASVNPSDDPERCGIARAYLYPEDVKRLMDALESGDSETGQKIFWAVASDLTKQFGFEIP